MVTGAYQKKTVFVGEKALFVGQNLWGVPFVSGAHVQVFLGYNSGGGGSGTFWGWGGLAKTGADGMYHHSESVWSFGVRRDVAM